MKTHSLFKDISFISDDESLNHKHSRLINLLYPPPIIKQSPLIKLKIAHNNNSKLEEDGAILDPLKPPQLTSTSNRIKSHKILKNLQIQIPDDSLIRSSLILSETPRDKNTSKNLNIEEILDILEGPRASRGNSFKDLSSIPASAVNLHRRCFSEHLIDQKKMFNALRFKKMMCEMKNASNIDLIEILNAIQREMHIISTKSCYEVPFFNFSRLIIFFNVH